MPQAVSLLHRQTSADAPEAFFDLYVQTPWFGRRSVTKFSLQRAKSVTQFTLPQAKQSAVVPELLTHNSTDGWVQLPRERTPVTSRTLIISIVSLVLSACGGSSGGGGTSPPPPPPPPTNAAPVVDAGADATIRLPEDTVALDATVTDDGNPAGAGLSYSWVVQSGPAGATFADPNAEDTSVTVVSEGTYVLELTADDTALQGSDTLTIIVEAAPAVDTVTVSPASISLAPGAIQAFSASGTDQYGDPITVNAMWSATGGTIDADGNYTAGSVAGDYTVTATDGAVSGTANVTISASPPTANAGGPYTGVEGAPVALDGSGSTDSDNDIVSYEWDLNNDGVFDDATGVNPTFAAGMSGAYTIGLLVTDADGASDTDSTTVTITNVAPTANAGGPYSGDQFADIALDGSASSDPGGDALTYAWDLDNDGVFDDAVGVTATFNSATTGDFTVGLQVTDDDGASDSTTTTVTVANAAPSADAGPDQSVSQGDTVTLDGSASSDPGGEPLTYAWTLTSIPAGSTAVLSDPTAVGPTFVADLAGIYVAELVVNDGTSDSAPDTVTVTAGDIAPAAPAGLTASGEDGQVVLDWDSNTEPDLAASPYRVSRSEVQGGPYTDVSGALATSSYTDAPVDNDTTYYYVVTAEDAGGNTSANSVEVAVTPNGPSEAYWTMEEGAGLTTADTVGSSNGTLVGATWTTGASGNGLDFDGISSHVVIDNTTDLQITGREITLMAWIYPRDGSGTPGPGIPGGSRVISKRIDAGGNDVYAMKLEDYRLCFRLAENSCQWSDHILVLNEWVHVAMVYDGSDKRIYVNGALDDSGPEPRTAPIEFSSRAVYLGMREEEGRFFNGVLDEVQILNRALSAAEVQAIAGAITPPPPAAGLRFTDITESAGTAGPAVGGRGIMFAEVDNDSLPDFYLTSILQNTSLRKYYFENNDGTTFTEAAEARGIEGPGGGGYGAVWADLDNDGDYDLFSASTWEAANTLPGFPEANNVYSNDGTGTFTDVTPAAISTTEIETRGVTAFDMDGDGDLDLYGVTGSTTPGVSEAYLNGLVGGAGAFDFTTHVGGDLTTAVAMNGVTDTDFDNDGDIDVLSANRLGEFAILQNDGSGTFTQVLPSALSINQPAGTGITPADIDNDGDLDLLLTAQNLQSYLYRRENSGSYVLQQTFVNGWMGSFADLDNDGDLDLVFSGDYRSYLNDGSGTFAEGQSVPVSDAEDARTIAFADIDSDGDLDFAVSARLGRNTLVRNDIDAAAGNWLRVELVSPTCQAGAFGARTSIYAAGDAGGTLLAMRESRGNHGYHAQTDPVLHFGLGSVASVDVVVDFLDGTQTIVPGVGANQRILVDECP